MTPSSGTPKRRWKTTHAFVVGTGLLASTVLLANATPTPHAIPPRAKNADLRVARAGYSADGHFSYAIENPGPTTSTKLTVTFAWIDLKGGVVSSSIVTAPIMVGAGTPVVDFGLATVRQAFAPKDFFTDAPTSAATFRVTLDPDAKIVESDETNNARDVPVTAAVHFENVVMSPDGNLSFTVVNNGPATVPAFRLTANQTDGGRTHTIGAPYSVDVSTPLAPMGVRAVTAHEPTGGAINGFIHQYAYGARAVRLDLAILGTVKQVATSTVSALIKYPVPTLEITTAAYAPGSDLRYTIKNSGVWAADRPAVTLAWVNSMQTVASCVSDTAACAGFIPGSILRPGESQSFTLPAVAPFLNGRPVNASALHLTVRAGNGQNAIVPLAPTSFTWALPDLVPIGASFITAKQLRFAVKNIGTATANGFTADLRWRDATGNEIGSPFLIELPSLLPGGSLQDPGLSTRQAEAFISSAPRGASSVQITIDPNSARAESQAMNNQVTVPFP